MGWQLHIAPMNEIEVIVNGEARRLAAGLSVAGLIDHFGFDYRKVAVERNREIVPRSLYALVGLLSSDQIEIVHFIGGG